MADAYSTISTFLMVGSGSPGTYSKLCDIKSTPDLGGKPNMLQTTTLSDGTHTYVPGVKDMGDGLEFTANYTPSMYNTLIGGTYKDTEKYFAIWMGGTSAAPTGANGKLAFKGILSAYLNAADVDGVREMTIVIAPTSEPTFSPS